MQTTRHAFGELVCVLARNTWKILQICDDVEGAKSASRCWLAVTSQPKAKEKQEKSCLDRRKATKKQKEAKLPLTGARRLKGSERRKSRKKLPLKVWQKGSEKKEKQKSCSRRGTKQQKRNYSAPLPTSFRTLVFFFASKAKNAHGEGEPIRMVYGIKVSTCKHDDS
ncbi:MAG: hypothetical protein ACLTSD_04120 [Eubacterium sp.]